MERKKYYGMNLAHTSYIYMQIRNKPLTYSTVIFHDLHRFGILGEKIINKRFQEID